MSNLDYDEYAVYCWREQEMEGRYDTLEALLDARRDRSRGWGEVLDVTYDVDRGKFQVEYLKNGEPTRGDWWVTPIDYVAATVGGDLDPARHRILYDSDLHPTQSPCGHDGSLLSIVQISAGLSLTPTGPQPSLQIGTQLNDAYGALYCRECSSFHPITDAIASATDGIDHLVF